MIQKVFGGRIGMQCLPHAVLVIRTDAVRTASGG